MRTFRGIEALVVMAVFSALGQTQSERSQPRSAHGMNHGNWVGKRVLTKEFMDKVGLQGEQAAKIKAEFERIDATAGTLEEAINKAALEQAAIAKKVLAEPGADTAEIMKLIERIGQYRTEQAKLATQRLVVIRDNLTAPQREKASALIHGEGKRRLEERAARAEREERERGGSPTNHPALPKGK